MAGEEAPPFIWPEDSKRIARLLGSQTWVAEVERFVAERGDLFAPNKMHPFPKLSKGQADQLLSDLQLV